MRITRFLTALTGIRGSIAFALLLLMLSGCKFSAQDEPGIRIIPQPVQITYAGKMLAIRNGLAIGNPDKTLHFAAACLENGIRQLPHQGLLAEDANVKVRLELSEKISQPEGYQLKIEKSRSSLPGERLPVSCTGPRLYCRY